MINSKKEKIIEVANGLKRKYGKKHIIILIVLVIVCSNFVKVINKNNIKYAVQTISLIKDDEDIKAIELYGKNKDKKVYANSLIFNIEKYSDELLKTFIENSNRYEYCSKKFNLILSLYNSEVISENYEKLKEQKSYIDAIEEAKRLESDNKFSEAYLKTVNIDGAECIIYPEVERYTEKLKEKSFTHLNNKVSMLSNFDAYLYIRDYPIKFDSKIEDYKGLVIDEINRHIKTISHKEALKYLKEAYIKLNLTEINTIKNDIQEEYDRKLEAKKREEEALEERKEEQEKIRLAKVKLENILPEYKHSYIQTEIRSGEAYWVFSSTLNGYEAQFRPYVNTKNYDVYQLYVDDMFLKFGEPIKERYENKTIAEINGTIPYGGYRVRGKVVVVDSLNMLLRDDKGNYLHVTGVVPMNIAVGSVVTVTGDYYGNSCDDKYAYLGVIPITVKTLNLGKVE